MVSDTIWVFGFRSTAWSVHTYVMGRQLRIDPEMSWHHVMNRGAGRRDVFDTSTDGRQFLNLVGQNSLESNVEVHAYCLMNNHYHLLLRSIDGHLSQFMQQLGSVYTRSFNVRRGSDGPIFRSRFHSLLCTSTTHVDHAWRYIHRNPLDVRPRVALDEWKWSSYGIYTGRLTAPSWLKTSLWLDWHGGRSALRQFVEGDGPEPDDSATDRWRWAIQTALAEFAMSVEHAATAKLERTITSAASTLCPGPVANSLLETLEFANDRARDRAVKRATDRATARPEIEAVVRRAAALAS